MQEDVRDAAAVDALAAGVHGIVHLGGEARRRGVARVIFASSHHAVGFRPRDRRVDCAAPILAAAPAADSQSLPERMQGGDFAVVEVGGGAPYLGGDD